MAAARAVSEWRAALLETIYNFDRMRQAAMPGRWWFPGALRQATALQAEIPVRAYRRMGIPRGDYLISDALSGERLTKGFTTQVALNIDGRDEPRLPALLLQEGVEPESVSIRTAPDRLVIHVAAAPVFDKPVSAGKLRRVTAPAARTGKTVLRGSLCTLKFLSGIQPLRSATVK